MPRRPCCKRVSELPGCCHFVPPTARPGDAEEVRLSVEELEALRLAHMEGLYQEQAAGLMDISRATFGRLLEEAHRKVTYALVKGCALHIGGGDFHTADAPRCPRCRHHHPASQEGEPS